MNSIFTEILHGKESYLWLLIGQLLVMLNFLSRHSSSDFSITPASFSLDLLISIHNTAITITFLICHFGYVTFPFHTFTGSHFSIAPKLSYLPSLWRSYSACLNSACHLSFRIVKLTLISGQPIMSASITQFKMFRWSLHCFLPCFCSCLGGTPCNCLWVFIHLL